MKPFYKFGHMSLWHPAILLGVFLGTASNSSPSLAPRKPINPLELKCILRDGKFYTTILFSKNSEGVVGGEMGNYVSTPDHGRRFLSGIVFFDLELEPRLIQGGTGDKRGNISAFRLYPASRGLTGEWIYEQFDGNSAPIQVRFNCTYRG